MSIPVVGYFTPEVLARLVDDLLAQHGGVADILRIEVQGLAGDTVAGGAFGHGLLAVQPDVVFVGIILSGNSLPADDSPGIFHVYVTS